MPTYLVRGSYTPEGLRALRDEGATTRVAAIGQFIESLGGQLRTCYWSFGDDDIVVVFDLPDDIGAAAAAIANALAGRARTSTSRLLTAEEIDEALRRLT